VAICFGVMKIKDWKRGITKAVCFPFLIVFCPRDSLFSSTNICLIGSHVKLRLMSHSAYQRDFIYCCGQASDIWRAALNRKVRNAPQNQSNKLHPFKSEPYLFTDRKNHSSSAESRDKASVSMIYLHYFLYDLEDWSSMVITLSSQLGN